VRISRRSTFAMTAAAVVLSLTLTGCGSEVEGTNSDTLASVTTPTTPSPTGTEETLPSSTQLVNAHRKPLKVMEDLGVGEEIAKPDKNLNRCNVPMQKTLPRAKAAAIFTSTNNSLLVKIVVAGQLKTNQTSLFTFSANEASNQRIVGFRNGVVTRNSVVINKPVEGQQKVDATLRGFVSVEPTDDGFILGMEIPRNYVSSFNSRDWAVSITLGDKKINGCGAA